MIMTMIIMIIINIIIIITVIIIFATAKVASLIAIIYFHIILHPAVHIRDLHIFVTSSSSFHRFITNQFNDLLPVGLLAQWVRVWIKYRSEFFFQAFFSQLQKLRL